MSRRAPNPAAERAAQNQATIKSLLKLEPNKVCADCKRNKHPRWASWNLGVFICIRCSGIHRGMGTHISRVKSVDLDSWTDEQLQSVLSWGNARANRYFEAKLAPNHVPSEAKIENFIRTKYELKRWAMDGPRPDPKTLDAAGDDDVPLSLVREKQAVERKASAASARTAAPEFDLIGGVDPVPARPTSAAPSANNRVPPKAEAAPPKATTTNSSLLGLDFLGESTAPPRPASTTGVSASGGQSRPDLKQSILSLYASVPKPQPPQQPQHHSQDSFGGMGSPGLQQQSGSFGGFNDAFSNLSMSSTTSPKPQPSDPFANFGNASTSRAPPQATSSTGNGYYGGLGGLSGGSFFDAKPSNPPPISHQKKPSSGGFGDFGDFTSPAPAPPKPVQTSSSSMGDLFDLSAPTTTTSPPPAKVSSPPASSSSVFNLSAPQTTSAPALAQPASKAASSFTAPAFDAWGGNEWATPEPAAAPSTSLGTKPAPPAASAPTNDFGWGSTDTGGSFANTPIVPGSNGGFNPAPKVAADEEFGGWSSSAAPSSSSAKPAVPGNDEDLFSNVWS